MLKCSGCYCLLHIGWQVSRAGMELFKSVYRNYPANVMLLNYEVLVRYK